MADNIKESDISEEELYRAIVERILAAEGRFKTSVMDLIQDVCKSRFGRDLSPRDLDMTDMFFRISDGARENGYAMRAVPSPADEREGSPESFEYYFYPSRKDGNKKLKQKSEVIILSRMYVGSYLEENIGHEVINLFKSDNGNNYIYVNEDGRINPKYDDSVRAVLLVKYVEPGVMEVVAKAEELEQILYWSGDKNKEISAQEKYIEDNHVTYGDVSINKIYTDQQYGIITFKTNHLRLPVKQLYLIEDPAKCQSYENYVLLPEKHFSSQSLKMYYPKDGLPKDYNALVEMLASKDLWEMENTTQNIDLNDQELTGRGKCFLNIIKKEYDELVYSNLFVYFFERNRKVFTDFAGEVLQVKDFSKNYVIRREYHNIDLLIEGESHVLVIENKIKSKINGERHDVYSEKTQSQLEEYYKVATKEFADKDVKFFIFSPDYNDINLEKYASGEHYKPINYSAIYEFYKKRAGEMLHMEYFKEFLDALQIHSKKTDVSNFDVMKERFISRIKQIREVQL